MNQNSEKKAERTFSRHPHLLKALLNAVYEVVYMCTFFLGLSGTQMVKYSQVPWASQFLTNLKKIFLLLGNVLKLNFPLYLAETFLKDLVS